MADKGRRRAEIDEYEAPEFEEAPTAIAPAEETTDLVEEARFFIDPHWYDERGIAFNTVAQARLCPSCRARLGTFTEERYPVIDPKTKRVTFEYRQVPYAAHPLPIIRDHCSRERDYVTGETPLLEALFRVFLASGNQPMTLATLREHLLTYIPEMSALRSEYPVEYLERMLRGDVSYGMGEQKLPTAV